MKTEYKQDTNIIRKKILSIFPISSVFLTPYQCTLHVNAWGFVFLHLEQWIHNLLPDIQIKLGFLLKKIGIFCEVTTIYLLSDADLYLYNHRYSGSVAVNSDFCMNQLTGPFFW